MRKAIAFILTAIMLLSVLTGCTGGGEEVTTETPETTAEPVAPVKLSGGEEYKIIIADGCNSDVYKAVKNLASKIDGYTGGNITIQSDIISAAVAAFKETPYEIQIGAVNRDASRSVFEALKSDDYAIKVCGTQVVVCGGSDAATLKAIKEFSGLITEEMQLDGDLELVYTGSYQVNSIKLNGVDLFDYTIVFPSSKKAIYGDAIDAFIERVRTLTGRTLETQNSYAEKKEHELLFGNCERGASVGIEAVALKYTIAAAADSVAVVSGSSIGANAAIESFLEKYLPKDASGDIEIKLEGSETCNVSAKVEMAKEANIRVMTSNLLGGSDLTTRVPNHVSVFSDYLPDVIGLQEANSNGTTALKNQLGNLYAFACVTIDGKGTNCYTPIMYLKDKYELVESGNKLFDQRWTGTDTKTFSWVVLKNKETGKLIAVINAHWSLILSTYDTEAAFGKKMTDSVEGVQWRQDNTREILEKAAELRTKYGATLPVVAMGDMNATATAKSVTMFSPLMSNCLNISKGQKTTGINSFHSNPGQGVKSGSPIDNIVVTDDVITCYRHEIVTTSTALAASDHCHVTVDLNY